MRITLRPHHLLCTQSYSGKGYDDAFVENMNRITAKLRSEEATPVDIIFSTDSLCSCCPKKISEGHCSDNCKVLRYDAKVTEYFHLEEKTYIYQDITRKIREQMTPEMLEDICKGCGWYPVSACKKILTGQP